MNDLSIAAVPSLANNSLTYAAPTLSSSSSSSTAEKKKKKKTNKVGWSKGFLNSTTQLKRKTMTTTSDEIYEVDVNAKDSSIVVQAASSDTLQSMDNNTNTTSASSIVKTNEVVDEVGIVEIDKPEVIVASKKNVAFTGHIFERITP